MPSVLGTDQFMDWLRDSLFPEKSHEEVPESRLLALDREQIKGAVCKTYHVNEGGFASIEEGCIE